MNNDNPIDSPEITDPARLKYYRHPSFNSNTYYGAYGRNRVRVKRGDQWGEFDRNGSWIAGELRYADPTFCRWVTGEHIYNERLRASKSEIFSETRLADHLAEKLK